MIGGLLRAGADGTDYRVVAILPYQAKATEPDGQEPAPGRDGEESAPSSPAGIPPARGRSPVVAVGVACILLLFAASVLLSARTASMYLSRAVYDSVQVDQSEQAVTRRLPHQLLAGSQDVGTLPPPGASCKLFWVLPSDAGPDRSLDTRYRLCFRGGVLVEKRELRS